VRDADPEEPTMTPLPSLPAIVEQHAAGAAADRTFLEEVGGPSQTYREAHERSRRIAASLRRAGVSEGDRVLLFVPLSVDLVDIWLALGWAGAVAVPVNLEFRGPSLSFVLDDARADMVICSSALLPRILEFDVVGPALDVVVLDDPDLPERHHGMLRVVGWNAVHDDATAPMDETGLSVPPRHQDAVLMYTSGTTGGAKGAMLPWGVLSTSGDNIRAAGGWTGDDALYLPFPPNHISSNQWLAGMTIAGGRIVLRDGFKTDTYWSEINRHACTVTLMVGAMALFLLRRNGGDEDVENTLRRVCLVPAIEDRDLLEKRFGVSSYTIYGSTEMGIVMASEDSDVPAAGCGRLLPGFRARIVDENDETLPDGHSGQLVLRHDEPWTTFNGYFGNPEATAAVYDNLWFHTGDAFLRQPDGQFVFVDRIKDVIRRRGENISSIEVEAYVGTHDSVVECAAVPVPADDGEDEIKVCVSLREGHRLDPADLIAHLESAQMPSFMVPAYVDVLDELPKTPTNKIRKAELRGQGVTTTTWRRPARVRG
jgi:carnitine-CoA ligase